MYTLILDALEMNVLIAALEVSHLMSSEIIKKDKEMTTAEKVGVLTQNAVEEILLQMCRQMKQENPSE